MNYWNTPPDGGTAERKAIDCHADLCKRIAVLPLSSISTVGDLYLLFETLKSRGGYSHVPYTCLGGPGVVEELVSRIESNAVKE
jgi:hypothetical protein